MVVHLRIGVQWNLVALWKSLHEYLVYLFEGNRMIECRPLVEAEWLIAAHDRAPSHDGGSMWFMLVIGLWLYVRLGRANYRAVENTG
jgi:hypothetical protein